ncbi:hypothetical protein [Sphingomonas sp. AX6]|nr:hypothetical protein [Sphingomonas sp. AX6]VXC60512.1 hypothetical protein SPHINGOAX6_30090 [Sphingomonas sp. AX6]
MLDLAAADPELQCDADANLNAQQYVGFVGDLSANSAITGVAPPAMD